MASHASGQCCQASLGLDEDMVKRFTEAGQAHVFRFAHLLTAEQVAELQNDLRKINLDELKRVYNQIHSALTSSGAHVNYQSSPAVPNKPRSSGLAPLSSVPKLLDTPRDVRENWRKRGMELIASGKVAALVLAGGQGTRLGCVFPKGLYNIGLPSQKTLFQIQAERILRLQSLAAEFATSKKLSNATCIIPWYVMTSPQTDIDTRKFFRENNFFGLQSENVVFFCQGTMPCITPDGKIIMESAYKVAVAPDGNGGMYKALDIEGVLADMQRRGLKYIAQYCVDNILVKIADPVFVGFMDERGADIGCKVTAKLYPEEPVGILCLRHSRPEVVEYSEFDKELARQRTANGDLEFNTSHLCINFFTVEFLQKAAHGFGRTLKYHIALKKIPCADDAQYGRTVTPPEANGWKLEQFIFDVFPFSERLVAMDVPRDEEFSPIKNAPGSKTDCPETALKHITQLHIRYIRQAGGIVQVENEAATNLVEISPLLSYEGEGLEELVKGRVFTPPIELRAPEDVEGPVAVGVPADDPPMKTANGLPIAFGTMSGSHL